MNETQQKLVELEALCRLVEQCLQGKEKDEALPIRLRLKVIHAQVALLALLVEVLQAQLEP
jgi:hypothetical protein